MKFSLAAATAALVLTGQVAAQDKQSKPFHLVIDSSDKSLNGKQISACHSGAAIESLCIDKKGVEIHFNETAGEQPALKGYTAEGLIVYNLPAGDITESQPMSFYIDPSTNLAQTLFEPSDNNQYVAFDKSGQLTIISYLDDTKSPPADDAPRALNKWYVCQTEFEGYQYQTLNWLLGNGKPQNPSCIKVNVKKVLI